MKSTIVLAALVLACRRDDARGNHRTDPREGERRDFHQERSRTTSGGRPSPEGPGIRSEERPEQRGTPQGLDEITPQLIVDAVDEMVIVQRGKELGYTLSEEQFKKSWRHPQREQDRHRRAVSGRAQVRKHDHGRFEAEPGTPDDLPAGPAERSAGQDWRHHRGSAQVLRRASQRVHDASHGTLREIRAWSSRRQGVERRSAAQTVRSSRRTEPRIAVRNDVQPLGVAKGFRWPTVGGVVNSVRCAS